MRAKITKSRRKGEEKFQFLKEICVTIVEYLKNMSVELDKMGI